MLVGRNEGKQWQLYTEVCGCSHSIMSGCRDLTGTIEACYQTPRWSGTTCMGIYYIVQW